MSENPDQPLTASDNQEHQLSNQEPIPQEPTEQDLSEQLPVEELPPEPEAISTIQVAYLLLIVGPPIWIACINFGLGFGFQYPIPLLLALLLAALCGGLGGILLARKQRFAGFWGGLWSATVEILISWWYFQGREQVWNLELAIPLVIGGIVGLVIFFRLQREPDTDQAWSNIEPGL